MIPILIGYGANVPGTWGAPLQSLSRALALLDERGIAIIEASPLYETAPVGPAQQPMFLNGAARAQTRLTPAGLLDVLKDIEREAGRQTAVRWGPRALDIDILDYGGLVQGWEGAASAQPRAGLVLPHPELHHRAFVLVPLIRIAPDWRHPVLGQTPAMLLAELPGGGAGVRALAD